MRDWDIRPLKAFIDPDRSICYGIVQPGAPVVGGVPILRVNNFTGTGLTIANASYVAKTVEREYKRSRLQGGELLITLVGSLGLTAIAPSEMKGWNVARAVGVIPLAADADVRWINFVVRSRPAQDFIAMRANTTVQATFNLKDLAQLPIPMPPDALRRSMSELLSALDDKIELNRRMNETLEASARALFRDWFVDFGPTRAKAEGRPAYLAPDLWSLFPDRLGDGGVPGGWILGRVQDHLELNYGKSLPARDRIQGPYPVYGSGGVSGTHREAIVDGPAVIVGRKGTVGSLYWEQSNCYPIDTVFFVAPRVSLAFSYQLLASLPLKDMNTDAAVPGLNRENVYRLEVPRFPARVVRAYDCVAKDIRAQIDVNTAESRTLAETRDALLPKLMSGEIRVRDAEALAA